MEADRTFRGPIPALYDQYLGPMLFAPYADDLVPNWQTCGMAGCSKSPPERAWSRALWPLFCRKGFPFNATDLNQAMLDHASRQLSSARVTWRQADAQSLPFPHGVFDAVVCQFGVMFFPDKPRAFSEATRVLNPSGRFLFNVWDLIEENEFADLVQKSVAALFPNDPPMFLARTPHGHHDAAALEAELRTAGFAKVATETVTRESVSPSALSVAIGYPRARRCGTRSRPATPLAWPKRPRLQLPRSPRDLVPAR